MGKLMSLMGSMLLMTRQLSPLRTTLMRCLKGLTLWTWTWGMLSLALNLSPRSMRMMSPCTVGIYMRMSNPQAGQLEPLLDHQFCQQPCTTPPDELMTGTWEFEIQDLPDPHPMTLGKYDVWVLNGEGDGIAGPVIWGMDE